MKNVIRVKALVVYIYMCVLLCACELSACYCVVSLKKGEDE